MHTITWSSILTGWLYTLASRNAELTLLPEEFTEFCGETNLQLRKTSFPTTTPSLIAVLRINRLRPIAGTVSF